MYKNLSIRTKTMFQVAFGVLLLLAISLYAQFQIGSIGGELNQISEENIPMTGVVTEITVHQLEQTVQMERALRFGEQMGSDPAAAEHFDATVSAFDALAAKVDEEFAAGRAFAEEILQRDGDAEARSEFVVVRDALATLETEHAAFNDEAARLFEAMRAGSFGEARQMAIELEAHADNLDVMLSGLLHDLREHSATAAATAKAHEETAEIVLWAALAVGVIAAVGIGIFMAEMMIRPLLRSVAAIDGLADGDTTVSCHVQSRDEIGKIGGAIERLRGSMIRLKEMQGAEKAREAEASEKVRREMLALSDALDQQVRVAVGIIQEKAGDMQGLADEMNASAQNASAVSASVTSAAEITNSNVQTVASAAEEMSSSIAEISRQVDRSTTITESAVQEATRSGEMVSSLNEAAKEIEAIVTLINDIAEQTNLLALNATIEAARAGNAGKGFAVVASEVKSLANQTGKATEQIDRQIDAIQNATGAVVTAIQQIGSTVGEVSEITSNIAGAVKQQTTATQEIARSAAEAAGGTNDVSSGINEVTTATKDSGNLADQVRGNASEVNESVAALQAQITTILRESRAGNRRKYKRVQICSPTEVFVNGQWRECRLNDVSAGGAEIEAVEGIQKGNAIKLRISALGEFAGRVVRATELSRAIEFDIDEDTRAKLQHSLASTEAAADAEAAAETERKAA